MLPGVPTAPETQTASGSQQVARGVEDGALSPDAPGKAPRVLTPEQRQVAAPNLCSEKNQTFLQELVNISGYNLHQKKGLFTWTLQRTISVIIIYRKVLFFDVILIVFLRVLAKYYILHHEFSRLFFKHRTKRSVV